MPVSEDDIFPPHRYKQTTARICDRCGKIIVFLEGEYSRHIEKWDVYYAEYFRDSESIICNECLHQDRRYQLTRCAEWKKDWLRLYWWIKDMLKNISIRNSNS